MAGKEKRGASEADAGLFVGRTYVLTPERPEDTETAAAREFLGWLKAIGARVVVMPAKEHDRVVAYTSHLPQLLSTVLASTLAGRLSVNDLRIAGPGLANALRLAASSYEIWGDILATNTAAIEAALDAAITHLQGLRAHLNSDETRRAFELANDFAARLRQLD